MRSSRHLIGDAGLGQPDELSEGGIRSLRLDVPHVDARRRQPWPFAVAEVNAPIVIGFRALR